MRMDVRQVARLARLELSEAEASRFDEQLGAILDYMEELGELDTSDVSPMSHPNFIATTWREDEVGEGLSRREALANAPEQDGVAFVVPRNTQGVDGG